MKENKETARHFFTKAGEIIDEISFKYLKMREDLFEAVRKENHDEIDLLIRQGADINWQDVNGWTPLHIALSNYHYKTVLFLLKRGADKNIKTKSGKSGLDFIAFRPYELEVIHEFYNKED